MVRIDGDFEGTESMSNGTLEGRNAGAGIVLMWPPAAASSRPMEGGITFTWVDGAFGSD